MNAWRSTAFLAVALGSVLQGCDGAMNPVELTRGGTRASLARAETFTINERIPTDLVVFVPCANGGAGEEVQLSGILHGLVHTTINGNRFTVKTHFQPQGISGIGAVTGDKYQGTGVTQERFGGSFVNGQFSGTLVNNFRVVGQGAGNNFLVHELFHITVNAAGDVTVEFEKARIECK